MITKKTDKRKTLERMKKKLEKNSEETSNSINIPKFNGEYLAMHVSKQFKEVQSAGKCE